MFTLSSHGTDWGPWCTWWGGGTCSAGAPGGSGAKYLAHIQEAKAAVAQVGGGGIGNTYSGIILMDKSVWAKNEPAGFDPNNANNALAIFTLANKVLPAGNPPADVPGALTTFYSYGVAKPNSAGITSHVGQVVQIFQMGPGGGTGVGGYVNPLHPGWYGLARTDQGVDYLPNGNNTPVLAIGDGVVTYMNQNSGWPGLHGYMVYKLTAGPKAGYYIYVSENLTNMLPVGTVVHPGQQIAYSQPGYAWTEWGWSQPPGNVDWPAVRYNGLPDGTPTAGGLAFARFMRELGAGTAQDPGPGRDVPY
jgi:hypothetical protein